MDNKEINQGRRRFLTLATSGAGAIARFSIGIVIVAGLSIGTLFTLFVLPVIYTFLGQEHKPLREFDEEKYAKPALEKTDIEQQA